MNRQIAELHQRRGRLLERIGNQRAELAEYCVPVHATLDRTDPFLGRIHAAVYYFKTHPLVSAALALATVYVVKPKRAWRWSARVFSAWQTWRLMRDEYETR